MKTAIASFLEPKRGFKLYERLSCGSCINLHAHTQHRAVEAPLFLFRENRKRLSKSSPPRLRVLRLQYVRRRRKERAAAL
jgi:hypothetical protein